MLAFFQPSLRAVTRAMPLLACACALAQNTSPDTPAADSDWNFHLQGTLVNQWSAPFSAAYSGPNSLDATSQSKETADITFMVGRRLWKGAEFWFAPEIDQGFGLNNTLGAAGFPSGEAYKVGSSSPYGTLPRAFLRQVFDLSGEQQAVEAGTNQFAGSRMANNIVLTMGKFSAVDIFDNNAYAHDPRADFLNWSIIDAAAFDYAADSWGYTNGIAVEWNQDRWSLRGGLFQLSAEPNGRVSGLDFRQHGLIAELEERHDWGGHPGKLRFIAFVNRGDMANYQDAVQLAQQSGATPDVALVRSYASRAGVALNLEQELSSSVGLFARWSANDGSKEAYEFTDVNRSLSGGLSIQGSGWGRPGDRVGLGGAINSLSGAARSYFAAGGLGILIGDGALNYDDEKIIEVYYAMQLGERVRLSADYQRIVNPAYNQDRGPASIFGLRLHVEY